MLDLSALRGRRVLVTGGSGFIGQHVIAQGAKSDIEIFNFSSSGKQIRGAQTVEIDLRNHSEVIQQVHNLKPGAIIHLAAGGVQYGFGDMLELIQINVLGLQALLQAADTLPSPPHVVIAGSWFEYCPTGRSLRETDPTEPVSTYSVTKVAASTIARHYAARIPITLLRLFAVYGEGEPVHRLFPLIIDSAKRGRPVELTGCDQIRDYVYVDDAAEAFWRALQIHPSLNLQSGIRILNVGSGVPTRIKTLVILLEKLLESRGFLPDLRFGVKPYRSDENMFGVADISALKNAFGWTPSTNHRTGLEIMISSMIDQNHN